MFQFSNLSEAYFLHIGNNELKNFASYFFSSCFQISFSHFLRLLPNSSPIITIKLFSDITILFDSIIFKVPSSIYSKHYFQRAFKYCFGGKHFFKKAHCFASQFEKFKSSIFSHVPWMLFTIIAPWGCWSLIPTSLSSLHEVNLIIYSH